MCLCQSLRASPASPLPTSLLQHLQRYRLPCACRWLMELSAQWCQDGPEHLQHLTLTWNSKFVCSRNFWFIVSANLLIALRKTLEEETRLLDHSPLPLFLLFTAKNVLTFSLGKVGLQMRTAAGQHRGCGCLARVQQLSIWLFRNLSCLTFNLLKAYGWKTHAIRKWYKGRSFPCPHNSQRSMGSCHLRRLPPTCGWASFQRFP